MPPTEEDPCFLSATRFFGYLMTKKKHEIQEQPGVVERGRDEGRGSGGQGEGAQGLESYQVSVDHPRSVGVRKFIFLRHI